MIDWTNCPDAERTPGKLSGAWCVKGHRIPVQAILDNFEDGCSAEEIVHEIFDLPVHVVRRILDFANTRRAQPEVLSDAVDFEDALHPSGSCTKGVESKGNNRDALARLDVLASMDNAGSEHNDHFTWNQFEALWITMRRKQDQGCLRLIDVLVLQHD
jgi:uncharacterized protein (DUF433 family)